MQGSEILATSRGEALIHNLYLELTIFLLKITKNVPAGLMTFRLGLIKNFTLQGSLRLTFLNYKMYYRYVENI
jgi:hypothetical protein